MRLRKQLLWLIVLRVVVLTTLLASFIFIQILDPRAGWALEPFYSLLGGTFVLSLLYLLLYRFTRLTVGLAYVQFLGDVLIVSALVWSTGGLLSPFSFLYFVVILVASTLLFRQGALWIATISFVAYGLLAFLTYTHHLPPPEASRSAEERYFELALSETYYRLFLHMFGFYTVASLTSYLSESVRRTGIQIEERTSELRRLEALHGLIVESISSALVTTDEEGRATFLNGVAAEILEREPEQVVGEHLEDLFLPRGAMKEAVDALEARRAHHMEIPIRTPSGRALHLGVAASRLVGPSGGFLLLAEDFTELKRLEDEVRFKDRMAAVGEMAAGLAHEIRNPLASMSGSAQVLSRDLGLSGDQERLMAIILKESRRLDGIIREFLAYARTGILEPREMDLGEAARETLDLVRTSGELGEACEVRYEGGSVRCVADPNQVRTVLWNLLRNALRAMPDGGTLTVRVAEEERLARLVVADTGCGMSAEQQQAAMQPFHGSFPDGAGLGLSIVYRIVRDHGGEVTIRSRKGVGTEVGVTLPREPGRTVVPRAEGGDAAAR